MQHVAKTADRHKTATLVTLQYGTTLGKWSGGSFSILELDIKIDELPGGPISMSASLLMHCVEHILGKRTALIFTENPDVHCVRMHYRDTSQEEKDVCDAEQTIKAAAEATS